MTLTPLAAAMQGVGYGSYLTALQGLAEVTLLPAAPAPESQGSLGAVPTRRRTARRGVWMAAAPRPAKAPFADAQLEEEDDLLALGML